MRLTLAEGPVNMQYVLRLSDIYVRYLFYTGLGLLTALVLASITSSTTILFIKIRNILNNIKVDIIHYG